ncbi:hypothetical protein ACWDKQ_10335 [Saccharopolyspora sp. NPDC000995]
MIKAKGFSGAVEAALEGGCEGNGPFVPPNGGGRPSARLVFLAGALVMVLASKSEIAAAIVLLGLVVLIPLTVLVD